MWEHCKGLLLTSCLWLEQGSDITGDGSRHLHRKAHYLVAFSCHEISFYRSVNLDLHEMPFRVRESYFNAFWPLGVAFLTDCSRWPAASCWGKEVHIWFWLCNRFHSWTQKSLLNGQHQNMCLMVSLSCLQKQQKEIVLSLHLKRNKLVCRIQCKILSYTISFGCL